MTDQPAHQQPNPGSRSRFVTHWTGKDIQRKAPDLSNEQRKAYVERIRTTLDAGLWMTTQRETIVGWHPGPTKACAVTGRIPMTCFTELRLSASGGHTYEYGLLGFVFDREFVLGRYGGPVHYVRNHPEESVVGNANQLGVWIERVTTQDPEAEKAKIALSSIAAFLKPMSREGEDDFAYLNEHEWRIVHNHHQQQAGRIVPVKANESGDRGPEYLIPFDADDLKMLILPDAETREVVMQEDRILEKLSGKFPPLLTVEEVAQF